MPSRRRPTVEPVRSSDPMAGVERVYVDGSNLLHALARGRAAGQLDPAAAIIGRLRAAFPPAVVIDLVFDGPAQGGIRGRLATGLRVSYSGRETADRIIDEGVAAQFAADGPGGTWGILVVTDDRGLRDLVGAKGARVAGTAWLAGRIGRVMDERPGAHGAGARGANPPAPRAGTTIGHRRAPRGPFQPGSARDRDDR